MERRSLRGSAPGARRTLLQSKDRFSGPRHRGHGAHCFGSLRHPAARVDGRQTGAAVRVNTALALLLVGASACGRSASQAHGKRVIVLGVDGMDPGFVEAHWSALPNLRRLRDLGGMRRLATTTPPQSPVAWSTFITGADPSQHGIFDFVARDPSTLAPLSSMAETLEPERRLRFGPY